MFLESFGKTLFSKIRPLFFYFILCLLPLSAIGYVYIRHSHLQALEDRLFATSKKGVLALERKFRKERFIDHYSKISPSIWEEQIQSLVFLKPERDQIAALLQHPALIKSRILQERFSFLTTAPNRFVFQEKAFRSSSQMKETEEQLRHPVQMNTADLHQVLCYIENIPISSFLPPLETPQMFLLDFKMKKIQTPLHSEAYEVDMELLKRKWTL